MKKVLTVVLMLLIGYLGSKAYAEEIPDKCFLGLIGGGVIPDDEEVDGTFYIGSNFAYGLNDHFAVGAEVGYTSWDDEKAGVDYGEVNAVPMFGNIYLRHPNDYEGNLYVLYLKGGIGVVFWDYEESDILTNNSISIDAGKELSFKLGGGIDYFVTDNAAVNFESAYVWSDADMEMPAFGNYAATTVNTNYWRINSGIKFYF